MKLILALLLAAAPLSAFAKPFVMGTAINRVGGMNFLMSGADECATGMEVLVNIPFKKSVRGCVTEISSDFKNLHVVFEDGDVVDYMTIDFRRVTQTGAM